MDHIGIAHPFSPRLEIGPAIDDRRGRAERNAVARRRHPGTARLVEIMAGRRVAPGLIGLGGLPDLSGAIDLVLQGGGRDFRAILTGQQKPTLVPPPSEEPRAGEECVSTWWIRWGPEH